VDVERFWQVIGQARAAAGDEADRAVMEGRPSAVAEALAAELVRLPLAEILVFGRRFDAVCDRADSWNLCAACWVIEYGFLSDDGFSSFRAGLIRLGRAVFDQAVLAPDSLAAHPAVQEISVGDGGRWIGDEQLLFAASTVYESVSGDADAFWVAAASGEDDTVAPARVPFVEDRWNLRDRSEWRRRLPELDALFAARRRHA
jgi:hypothetical protein